MLLSFHLVLPPLQTRVILCWLQRPLDSQQLPTWPLLTAPDVACCFTCPHRSVWFLRTRQCGQLRLPCPTTALRQLTFWSAHCCCTVLFLPGANLSAKCLLSRACCQDRPDQTDSDTEVPSSWLTRQVLRTVPSSSHPWPSIVIRFGLSM